MGRPRVAQIDARPNAHDDRKDNGDDQALNIDIAKVAVPVLPQPQNTDGGNALKRHPCRRKQTDCFGGDEHPLAILPSPSSSRPLG